MLIEMKLTIARMLAAVTAFCATIAFCNHLGLHYGFSLLVSLAIGVAALIFERKHIGRTVHTVVSCLIGTVLAGMFLPGSVSSIWAIGGCLLGAGFSWLAYSKDGNVTTDN